jgi:hypothetical protein
MSLSRRGVAALSFPTVPAPEVSVTLKYIRRFCASSEAMHIDTARMIERLLSEPRYAKSAARLKQKPPTARR